MGKKSGRKVQKQGQGYDKGPKVKPSFSGSADNKPADASNPRELPRKGRHIFPYGGKIHRGKAPEYK